ncbi:RagB/SusD family nutrient uptake outer membrane protein [Saccharicrinis sp. FJH2]|uniref:RagB/SusD family nutrient uptake outer membrane protein n=1 Tax=Saccharicrinis sp. FJH65 TaxID=3344659 RepID=UPI0035F271D1
MKTKIILNLILLCCVYSISAKDIIYNISGSEGINKTSLDSIRIENLSNSSMLVFNDLPIRDEYLINLTEQKLDFNTGGNFNNAHGYWKTEVIMPGYVGLTNYMYPEENTTLTIYNIGGRRVFEESVPEYVYKINLSLPNYGFYIVDLHTGQRNCSLKAIGGFQRYNPIKVSYVAGNNSVENKSVRTNDFSFSIEDTFKITVFKNGYSAEPKIMEVVGDQVLEFSLINLTWTQEVLNDAYEAWRDSRIHSGGLFYELSVCSSDAERHPEKYLDQPRHVPENLYYGGTSAFTDIDFGAVPWDRGYDIITYCNGIISAFESSDIYQDWMKSKMPCQYANIYGQAVALRATVYYELTRYFGDIINKVSNVDVDSFLSSRDFIWEYHIKELEKVVPLMYRAGVNEQAVKTVMSRSYVEGLIGRMCLLAGGYSTRRTDLGIHFYHDLEGIDISFEQIGDENSGAVYNRRTDYKKFYEKARIYLTNLVENSGTAELINADPRGTGINGEQFGNPFQYKFQQMLDLNISTESVYEIPEIQGVYSERPYAFGRPSGGGGSNSFPCKSYGQSRMHPTFYYGDFDPFDMRRDVTVAVTASIGNGREVLLGFDPGNKTHGGLANNKWDENRMSPPYIYRQKASGVNNNYLHMSDVILMLAEVKAVLGDEAGAKTEWKKVRSRAFSEDMQAEKVDGYINSKSGEALLDAILDERKFELAGEGIRKWDMIRNGKFPQMIESLKAKLEAMIDGLESDGYYTFENGNTISNYVWTKEVDAGSELGYRLTSQCTDYSNPILFPGWRGQYNEWENVGGSGIGANYNGDYGTNTAIKGLFNHIEPGSEEAQTLEASGYEMQKWGEWLVEYREEYSTYVFRGYQEGKAPIYLIPLNAQTISTSGGKITNGYGFPQQ